MTISSVGRQRIRASACNSGAMPFCAFSFPTNSSRSPFRDGPGWKRSGSTGIGATRGRTSGVSMRTSSASQVETVVTASALRATLLKTCPATRLLRAKRTSVPWEVVTSGTRRTPDSEAVERTVLERALTELRVLSRADGERFDAVHGRRNDAESYNKWYKVSLPNHGRAASLKIDAQRLDFLFGALLNNAITWSRRDQGNA